MGKRVVIVGGVAAGMKTAARLRRLDAEAEIIVLERGPQLSYGACGFPYFISGEVKSMDSFDHTPQGALRDSDYFAAVKGIDARCGCNVQKIDRVQKCVHYMEKGELKKLSYDVLVLATGSTPVKLPLPNADAAGIHSFWFPWDVEAVDKEIAEGGVKDVVIIGAGFIGLELAEAFVRRGLHTSVLEQQDRLLPQLLDEDMAALLLRDTKNPLLDIYLEERAGAFTVENGKVSGVQTDKRVIPAQLVIVAVGVRLCHNARHVHHAVPVGHRASAKFLYNQCHLRSPSFHRHGLRPPPGRPRCPAPAGAACMRPAGCFVPPRPALRAQR